VCVCVCVRACACVCVVPFDGGGGGTVHISFLPSPQYLITQIHHRTEQKNKALETVQSTLLSSHCVQFKELRIADKCTSCHPLIDRQAFNQSASAYKQTHGLRQAPLYYKQRTCPCCFRKQRLRHLEGRIERTHVSYTALV